MIMNDGPIWMWKETVMAYFNLVSRLLERREYHDKEASQ